MISKYIIIDVITTDKKYGKSCQLYKKKSALVVIPLDLDLYCHKKMYMYSSYNVPLTISTIEIPTLKTIFLGFKPSSIMNVLDIVF